MDTNITADVHKSDDLDASAHSALLELDAPQRILVLRTQGLHHLAKLAERQLEGRYETNVLRRLQVPLEFSQVEMLEAELKNQGILPRNSSHKYSLTQIGSQQSSMWRWRAERYGGKGRTLSFTINLPEFVIYRAEQLLQDSEVAETSAPSGSSASVYGGKIDCKTSRKDELNYLERFAAYLCGAYDHAENRYQRGLNLVLQVLSCSASRSLETEREEGQLNFCLPLEKKEFLRKLKSTKSDSQLETILR